MNQLKTWLAWAAAMFARLKTAGAPAVEAAETGMFKFDDDVKASFKAAKSNRASWLFISVAIIAALIGGFVTGHAIAVRGVSAVTGRLDDAEKQNTALSALNATAKKELERSATALSDVSERLKTAQAELERLSAPKKAPKR